MAAPFSKIDFILILNFMENELKSKDEIIESLKKYKQYSQSSETKYGKIGPGRNNAKSPIAGGEKKVPSSEESGDYGIDPLAKLNKLIDSHKIITDGLQSRLASLSDLYKEISDRVASDALKRHWYEEENLLDRLVFEVNYLNRQLNDLRQESHSAAMKIYESHEVERLMRSTRRGAVVLTKLVSSRLKLTLEMASKCQEVNRLEQDLKNAKLRSGRLQDKLMQMVGEVCDPASQKKRLKADEMSKERNRLLSKVKMAEEQNIRLASKISELTIKQQHLHHHPHHLPQHVKMLEKDILASSNVHSHGPMSTVGSAFDGSSPSTKSQLHQVQGPYLSSTAIQILQIREGDKLTPKNLQTHPSSLNNISSSNNNNNNNNNNNVPLPLREAGKSPSRTGLCPASTPMHLKSSPGRDNSSKIININIVAGARFSAKETEATAHFRVNEEDSEARQRQQVRAPGTPLGCTRWSIPETEVGPRLQQHSDLRGTNARHHKQLLNVSQSPMRPMHPSPSPGRIQPRSAPGPPIFSSQSVRPQRNPQTTFDPSASTPTSLS